MPHAFRWTFASTPTDTIRYIDNISNAADDIHATAVVRAERRAVPIERTVTADLQSHRKGALQIDQWNSSIATSIKRATGCIQIKDGASMSSPTLSDAITQYGSEAYLLTVGRGGPHTTQVSVELRGNVIGCTIGPSAAKNIANESNVSLFWPPHEPGGYAMIVNGIASSTCQPNGSAIAQINLTKSVFHRSGPKPADSDGPCTSDCKRIARQA